MDEPEARVGNSRLMDMPVLEVAIGVVFLYLLLSLIVTTLQEALASLFKWRAQTLYDAIAHLLDDPKVTAEWRSLGKELYEHPLLAKLGTKDPLPATAATFAGKNRFRLPSYLPSRTFALALLDVLRQKTNAMEATGADKLLANARAIVEKLPDGELKRVLLLHVDDADQLGTSVDTRAKAVSARIETWFNDSMLRASGWYKRKSQAWSVAFGIAIAVATNADTFHVARTLWLDGSLRATVAASAEQFHAENAPPSTPPAAEAEAAEGAKEATKGTEGEDESKPTLANRLEKQLGDLEKAGLPLGWPLAKTSSWLTVVGWLVTGFAVSLGAAFWFDVLGRVLQLRGSGVKIDAATGKADER
jgi:hypothetical protein